MDVAYIRVTLLQPALKVSNKYYGVITISDLICDVNYNYGWSAE